MHTCSVIGSESWCRVPIATGSLRCINIRIVLKFPPSTKKPWIDPVQVPPSLKVEEIKSSLLGSLLGSFLGSLLLHLVGCLLTRIPSNPFARTEWWHCFRVLRAVEPESEARLAKAAGVVVRPGQRKH